MTTALNATLDAQGYAKVLILLKPGTALRGEIHPDQSFSRCFLTFGEEGTDGAAANLGDGSGHLSSPVRVFPRLGIATGFAHREGVKALRGDPRVQKIMEAPEISLIRPVSMVDAALGNPGPTWGLHRLGVPDLWREGINGEGVIVGHLDTGVDGSHPALAGAIDSFTQFDLNGDEVGNAPIIDSDDHGTHTAGTIVGRPVNNVAFGVAPGAKLASAMVIEGGQVIDRILGGMEWVIGQNARILSMSLGLRGFTPAFQVVMNAIRDNGLLPVIAVGNEGPNTSRSPGNYANVLSVGASDQNDTVADFSGSQMFFNRAPDQLVPDLVAPGVSVLSCVPGGGYMTMNGSSMATPHIAGLAALLFQAVPTATATQVEDAILASCVRPNAMPRFRCNRGVPNGPRALAVLRNLVGLSGAINTVIGGAQS